MKTAYSVIPRNNTWPADTVALAAALVAGADDEPDMQAAISFLFRAPEPFWARADFRDRYITRWWNLAGLDWCLLSDDVHQEAGVRLSRGEQAVCLLAASIANPRCVVQLATAIPALDPPLRRAWVDAMAYHGELLS